MDERKPDFLSVLALCSVLASWAYPAYQLPTDWSYFTNVATVVAALGCVTVLSLLIRMRDDYRWGEISLLIPAIALNLALSAVTADLGFPLTLNLIGTIAIGVWLGPHAGAASGICTALIGAVIAPAEVAFVPIYAFIGMAAGVASHIGFFRTGRRAALAGLLLGIPNAVLAAPMNAMVYGDVMNSLQAAIAEQRLQGSSLFEAVITQSLILYPIDRAMQFFLAWCVLAVVVDKRACKRSSQQVVSESV